MLGTAREPQQIAPRMKGAHVGVSVGVNAGHAHGQVCGSRSDAGWERDAGRVGEGRRWMGGKPDGRQAGWAEETRRGCEKGQPHSMARALPM
ncbi:hypothetical protein SAMD00023353_0701560 [Rosellinia necatrix]|uniref:Uncharacterized protein n=1 Tax=Rosellinia necatrix TaxID=77044 RepID=A0A1S8A625_ROSNE|nr:hypothetical protein SAMD00023353_0701560 [Rosellinia necatrix]